MYLENHIRVHPYALICYSQMCNSVEMLNGCFWVNVLFGGHKCVCK